MYVLIIQYKKYAKYRKYPVLVYLFPFMTKYSKNLIIDFIKPSNFNRAPKLAEICEWITTQTWDRSQMYYLLH